MSELSFLSNVDTSKVSEYSKSVLCRVLDTAGCSRATISSVCRTPYDQARIMHDNCVQHGAAAEMATYEAPGKAVVQVFIDSIHLDRDATIAAMESKIEELGSTTVSHHCADPKELQVFDLEDSSIGSFRIAVKQAALTDVGISKVLDENNVLHLEVTQPQETPTNA